MRTAPSTHKQATSKRYQMSGRTNSQAQADAFAAWHEQEGIRVSRELLLQNSGTGAYAVVFYCLYSHFYVTRARRRHASCHWKAL